MALANRIKVTTTTTGTGAITLPSTGVRDATNGDSLAPAEMLATFAGQFVSYHILSGNNFASGMGQLSSDCLTLTRDPNELSWNGSTLSNSLLSLAGTSIVFFDLRAADVTAPDIGRTVPIARGLVNL